MQTGFWTLADPTRVEVRIKRSLFIGEALPVESDEEAVAQIEAIRQREPKANHHCYAYVLGGKQPVQYQRFSDAGEPGGTAGRPILDAILGRDLQQVLVVVTRYFGGILLGAGGLVHAYSESAVAALEAGEKICYELQDLWSCSLEYALYDRFRYLLEQHRYAVIQESFGTEVQLQIAVRPNESESLSQLLQEHTAGRGALEFIEQAYYRRIHV